MNITQFGVIAVEFHKYAVNNCTSGSPLELFNRWSIGDGRKLLEANGVTQLRTLTEATIDEIIDCVCSYFNGIRSGKYILTREDIMSKRRPRKISEPRHICMYLAAKYVGSGLDFVTQDEQGKFFNVDRSIVSYAQKKVRGLVEFDAEFRTQIEEIEAIFTDRFISTVSN